MRLTQYCVSAVPLAIVAFVVTGGRVGAACGTVFALLLADVDHALDYWLTTRQWGGYKAFARNFVTAYRRGDFPVRYMPLHSFELLLFLWVLVGTGVASSFTVGLAIGLGGHVLLDWLAALRVMQPLFYWFWYRAANRFDLDRLTRPEGQASASAHQG